MILTAEVQGLAKAVADLASFGLKVKTRVVRKCVTAAAKPMARPSTARASRATGTLAKSGVVKIKSYRRGAVVVAIVGPKNRKYANGRNPAFYAHLVESGHRIAVGGRLVSRRDFRFGRRRPTTRATGRSIGFVSGKPFMRPMAKPALATAQRIFIWNLRSQVYAIANANGVILRVS